MNQLLSGKNIALVSDAGTPGISDPGYPLICEAIERGIQIIPIPGPSAVIAALAAAGARGATGFRGASLLVSLCDDSARGVRGS